MFFGFVVCLRLIILYFLPTQNLNLTLLFLCRLIMHIPLVLSNHTPHTPKVEAGPRPGLPSMVFISS